MKHVTKTIAVLGTMALTAGLSACSSSTAGDDSLSLVFLASSSQNGYNQAVYEGIEGRAAELSEELGVEISTEIQDGQFDANTQLSQMQNAGTNGQFDSIIVQPHDGPGLGAAFPLGQDVPVVAVLNPIGPDINKMEPQVEGVVSTVASPPKNSAKLQAETVVDYCADIDPCKIGLLAGLLNSPLDIERVKVWKEVLGEHDNIEIVATLEGGYDRDKSLTAVANLLQGNKDINGILSIADQQTMGAQIALENAGIEPSSIFLNGGGGTTEAIKAVREGKWTNDLMSFPVTMGERAVEQAVNAVRDEPVETVIDSDTLLDIGPIATKEDLEANPDFTGQWNG
ncbi:sugar ABC transporter substrate-binding protein [Brevibacterium sp.]|uniref:sugar ABC transporter substrate-binding protein n=1 Tax=Brevibacterium sp. TaxID=1701 RepID=UPI0028125F98|nr:sugar ABC transporter substrate-binding protein [Brevibacterium sp.]